MYEKGEGVNQDYKESAKWMGLSAAQGNIVAQAQYGFIFMNGKGVETNYVEAAKWLRLAAEQGYAAAQFNLSVLYATGRGVKEDFCESAKLLLLAAKQGVVDAQFNLGQLLFEGKGVELNYPSAFIWFSQAFYNGDEEALEYINRIEKILPTQELNEARKLANSYRILYSPKSVS